MADTTITCTTAPCVVVLQTDIPLLNLSTADALTISAIIAGAWATGFAFRQVIRLVREYGSASDESE